MVFFHGRYCIIRGKPFLLSDGLTRLFQNFLAADNNTLTFPRGIFQHDEIKRLRAFLKYTNSGFRIECIQRSDSRTPGRKLVMKLRRISLGQTSNHPAEYPQTLRP